uniref:GST C-terminal domain-containing protein n=1 Tax=Heterorhabditis bacteriophora TaxID=37862 RepID=A0A1I7WKK3_HETBA
MVTVWWSASGIMHYNFLDPGETISAEKVYQEIDKMHQELRRLRPALTLPFPAYASNLSATDYHLFKHLDNFF